VKIAFYQYHLEKENTTGSANARKSFVDIIIESVNEPALKAIFSFVVIDSSTYKSRVTIQQS